MTATTVTEQQLAPSQISRNLVANFFGTGWTAVMQLALISVYVRFLGVEAYGLVGALTTLQAIFTLLDLGLSTTLNRELARFSVHAERAREARDLVRTAEVLYWSIAAMIALTVSALAPLIAHRWIRAEGISAATVQQAFLIMGVIVALQFPFALYAGGLMGLQRQVLLNAITVSAVTVRGVGSVLLLWLIAPSVQLFFVWQLVATSLQTGLTAFFLWRSLPHAAERPRFRQSLLRTFWRFAAGMTGISITALLLTQSDKIILSRLLTLEQFGYYQFATVIASSLLLIVVPVFTAVFPRFSQLVARGDDGPSLPALYHSSCQVISAAMLPLAVTVALFSPEILRVLTHDPMIVDNTHLLVSLLIIGTALNGLMNIPYALQLAYGWTKLPFYQNIIAIVLLMPLLVWATITHGAIGAAAIWIAVNAGYVLIGIQVMHARLLPGEKAAWYVWDIGLPLMGALGVGMVGRILLPTHASALVTIGGVALIGLATLLSAGLLTPIVRHTLSRMMSLVRATKGTYAE